MIHDNRDPVKEIVRILAEMSPEQKTEFCKEIFKYNPSRPFVTRTTVTPA
jgi:hypothetical protein